MKKTFFLCFLMCLLIANRSVSQDANEPLSGIINTVQDVELQVNSTVAPDSNESADDLMMTTTCDSMLSIMTGGNGNRGNMFDVTAINALKITKFDVHLDSFKITTYKIFYHMGTYQGTENDPAAWTLLGYRDSVRAKPPHHPTPLNIPINVVIPAGITCAFYITSTISNRNNNYTNGTSLGAIYTQDPNIILYQGCGIEYPFSGTPHVPRIWNGRIHYCLQPVGINEPGSENVKTSVSPNPFNSSAIITIGGKTPCNYSLRVFDLLGNTVAEQNHINTNEVKVEREQLSEGMYIYKLFTKEGTAIANGKLIIE